MKSIFRSIVVILFLISLSAFATESPNPFKDYWYKGKAELNRYSLEQSRYGQIHKGEAVLIFVTEPFLTDTEVKYEHGDRSKAVPVLKLNFTRRFFTGIYPYTLITSTFSPVDFRKQRTLKIASSTQEWCGVTYSQLNWKNDQYHAMLHSYFQDEADRETDLNPAWLEDEIWTRIRLSPETLPTGNVQMLPGFQYIRMMHQPVKAQNASISLTSDATTTTTYKIEYKDLKRQVVIKFEKQFPHAILGWEETAPGGFTLDSPVLTTRAVRTNSILLNYWDHHGNEDAMYRKQLGLTQQ